MKKINIVNSISFFRILSAPIILWLILEDKLEYAFWIFIVASFSDIFDGFIARKLNLVTDFGKILDPISDKILIFSILLALSYKNMLATPIIIIIILRDFIILIGTVLALLVKKKFNYTPLKIGKFTFFSQCFSRLTKSKSKLYKKNLKLKKKTTKDKGQFSISKGNSL